MCRAAIQNGRSWNPCCATLGHTGAPLPAAPLVVIMLSWLVVLCPKVPLSLQLLM